MLTQAHHGVRDDIEEIIESEELKIRVIEKLFSSIVLFQVIHTNNLSTVWKYHRGG